MQQCADTNDSLNREELLQDLWQEQMDYYTLMTEYETIQYCINDIVLKDSELLILRIIGQNPNITITHIASHVRKTASAVSQIVKRLIEKDFVVQDRNAENRRVYNLSLTELGEKLFEDSSMLDKNCMFKLFGKLSEFSDDELRTYINIQKRIRGYIEDDICVLKNTMLQRTQNGYDR